MKFQARKISLLLNPCRRPKRLCWLAVWAQSLRWRNGDEQSAWQDELLRLYQLSFSGQLAPDAKALLFEYAVFSPPSEQGWKRNAAVFSG